MAGRWVGMVGRIVRGGAGNSSAETAKPSPQRVMVIVVVLGVVGMWVARSVWLVG